MNLDLLVNFWYPGGDVSMMRLRARSYAKELAWAKRIAKKQMAKETKKRQRKVG